MRVQAQKGDAVHLTTLTVNRDVQPQQKLTCWSVCTLSYLVYNGSQLLWI